MFLADPLPLRASTDLPNYATVAALPLVYGRVAIAPLRLDARGLEWLLADHAIAGVQRVSIEGQDSKGWQLVQRLDDNGHAIAVLKLSQAAKEAPRVYLAGARSPHTGEVLEHPCDIAIDLLTRCGLQPPAGAFGELRRQWPDGQIGAVFADSKQALRDALAAIFASSGAHWLIDSSRGRWLAAQGTSTADGEQGLSITPAAEEVRARIEAHSVWQRARVRFDYDFARQQARQAVLLTVRGAPESAPVLELDLPFLRLARHALAIGRQRLAAAALGEWQVEARIEARQLLLPGMAVDVAHPWLPAGRARLDAVSWDIARQAARIRARLPAAGSVQIDLARAARAFDEAAAAPLPVEYKDGMATFTVLDQAGAPIANAAVTLDGLYTANTNAGGQVTFKTARGEHTLTVYKDGFETFEMSVVV